MAKTAIIIGAGPAGLTAAYELLQRTDIRPIIIEKTGDTGGLSKTVNYKGNRMDIGGHRFFSKSDRVMDWWLNILALEKKGDTALTIQYQNQARKLATNKYTTAPADPDKIMMVRTRVSRIYYLKKFFTYPITLSWDTISKLGFVKIFRIFFSYMRSKLFPRKKETTLEDFLINRFGKNLYLTFFKDYTEKVWGVPCNQIPAEWGAQRIKELSITKALAHAIKKKFGSSGAKNLAQKDTVTTLIQNFLYPKYGPGQLWEEVARIIKEKGGEIHYHLDTTRFNIHDDRIVSIEATDQHTSEVKTFNGDYFFSTMPVKELVAGMATDVPRPVATIAAGLQYRDFITVGVLVKKLRAGNEKEGQQKLIDDNWIYIQEKEVKVGRLQIFNNWSPFMVKDPDTVWLGLEYFCNKEDAFWNMEDGKLAAFAIDELAQIDIIDKQDVLDHTVIRMEKTYPAYFGAYEHFPIVREWLDRFSNLFLIGRNGMHKYNNADHSMLTAMTAVDNIVNNVSGKDNIWEINTEQDYQG